MPETTIVCPHCDSHLELPDGAGPEATLACPVCDAQFSAGAAALCPLPVAKIVPVVESSANEQAAPPSDALSRLLSEMATPLAAEEKQVVEPSEPADDLEPPRFADVTLAASEPPTSDAAIAAGPTPTEGESLLDQLLAGLIPAEAARDARAPQTPFPALASFESEFADAIDVLADRPLGFEPLPDKSANVDEEIAEHETEFAEETADDFATVPGADFEISAEAREAERQRSQQRRPRSATRLLVGLATSGVVGILLGGYALLWIRGPQGDLLHMADWLPEFLLPSSAASPFSGARRELTKVTVDDLEEPAPAPQTEAAPLDDAPADDVADHNIADQADDDHAAKDPPGEETPRYDPAVAPVAFQSVADDLAASAPADAQPLPGLLGALKGVPLASLDELKKATADAEPAAPQLLTGDLAKPESVAGMGRAYVALCELAERFTLADPATTSAELATQQTLAKNLFAAVAANEDRRHDLGVIAVRWLQHQHRQNHGILALGRVTGVRPGERWTEFTLAVKAGNEEVEIPVLADHAQFAAGDQAAVAGILVERPQDVIAGYEGDAPKVVVAGDIFAP